MVTKKQLFLLSLLVGKYRVTDCYFDCFDMLIYINYSIFDGNHATDGAAINMAHYSAKFDNVTFKNNRESTIRVRFNLHMDICTYIHTYN